MSIEFFMFSELEKSDNGVYTCITNSENGRAIWSATLRLESPTNPNIGFFRSPEPSTYPGPPTRPTAINKTRTGVTITWSRNNKIGSSSLLGYQVRIYILIKLNVFNARKILKILFDLVAFVSN